MAEALTAATPAPPEAPAPAEERGSLVIADRVVERIASKAAAEINGVVPVSSGLGKFVGRTLPKANARVGGGRVRVQVEIAALWPTPLASLAGNVRDNVAQRITALVGFQVDGVDVEAVDIVTALPTERKVR